MSLPGADKEADLGEQEEEVRGKGKRFHYLQDS